MTDKNIMSASWWAKEGAQGPVKEAKGFKRTLRHGPALLAASVAVLIPFSFMTLGVSKDPNEARHSQLNAWQYPATVDATLQQCGGTFTFEIMPSQYAVLPADYDTDTDIPWHDHIVPAYGYFAHDFDGDVKKYYSTDDKDTPNYAEALRLMYDGYKIIWYPESDNPGLSSSIQGFVKTHEGFIAIPWSTDISGKVYTSEGLQQRNLPADRLIGFSAWGITKSCGAWDAGVAEEFGAFVDEHQDMSQFPPREARTKKDGSLPEIAYNVQ